MGTVDFYCSTPQYIDHAAPIWQALDSHARGTFWIAPRNSLHVHARHRGVDVRFGPPMQRRGQLTVVFGAIDLPAVQRPVLADHGAGQTYVGLDHPSWAGGEGRDRVVRFLVPNDHAAAANRRRYPHIPNVVVGSPHVEQLTTIPRASNEERVTVVFSRHWDGGPLERIVPELRSAWRYWHTPIVDLARANRRGPVAFHAHPRCSAFAQRDAQRADVPFLPTFDEVVARADVYVVDNSSTGFEWAALDRPVVWLDAPWYRRDVEHGLRFWSHADVGIRVQDARALVGVLDAYAADPDLCGGRRRQLIGDVFPIIDGAARTAAAAIEELL
jgi:hypothetical protein